MANNAEYYYFGSISEALQSGKLRKGDIVFFKAVSSGKDKYGNPADSHIGFFWGDTPNENQYWHSSWNAAYGIEGAGTLVNGNQISVLSPFCVSYVYVFPMS